MASCTFATKCGYVPNLEEDEIVEACSAPHCARHPGLTDDGHLHPQVVRSTHSSVLVDMGKVVGVLRAGDGSSLANRKKKVSVPPPPEEPTLVVESGCATCGGVVSSHKCGTDLDASLCGDPLMYATFVAPVHQYSTETESSRQPSFNYSVSRQQSLSQKHGSFDDAGSGGHSVEPQLYLGDRLHRQTTDQSLDHEQVHDVYRTVPVLETWPSIPTGHSEEEDDDEELEDEDDLDEHMNEGLSPPPPPLESCSRPIRMSTPALPIRVAATVTSPMVARSLGEIPGVPAWPESEDVVRRRNKRERNRTTTAASPSTPFSADVSSFSVATLKRHPRSLSPSPSQSPSPPPVPAHRHRRTASPDEPSESSTSFHEHDMFCHPMTPQPQNRTCNRPKSRPLSRPLSPCIITSNSGGHRTCVADRHEGSHFCNCDSVRESWLSSGSENQASSSANSGSVRRHPMESRVMICGTSVHYSRPAKESGNSQLNQRCRKEVVSGRAVPSMSTMSVTSTACVGAGSCSGVSAGQVGVRPAANRGDAWSSRAASRESDGRHSQCSDSRGQSRSRSQASTSGRRGEGSWGSGASLCPLPRWVTANQVGRNDICDLEPMSLLNTDSSAAMSAKEEALIANLQLRFKKDQIYTSIGTLLLSINPYKKLPLYSPEVMDVYRCHCLYELPPHIYAVTDRAWRTLRDMNTDQCILITGEAGSGKTETAKLVLQYLAAVTGNSKELHAIKYQLLQSNLVLEAFGNAKTRLNDNSSRFGKYLEVSFDFKGDPIGGLITHFFLEKSRVSRHFCGERNFHIFYQLLAGADLQLLKELRLQRNPDNYVFLRRSEVASSSASPASSTSLTTASCSISSSAQPVSIQPMSSTSTLTSSADSFDDRRDFLVTKRAMEDLGLTPEEIHDVFTLVAAVLKLGNVVFVPTTNMDGTEGCMVSNDYELFDVCEILQGEFSMLQSSLTSRTVEIKNADYLVTDLSAPEASMARDALCRTLYSRLFTWLVSRINESLKVKTPRKNRILGILDMYGFECASSPERNGFEQLLINFANERIQQLVTEYTLHAEQEEYVAEAIEWSHIDYFSNASIVSLIERGSFGILSVLDEVCQQHVHLSHFSSGGGRGSGSSTPSMAISPPDELFLERLAERFAKHPNVQVGGRALEQSSPAHLQTGINQDKDSSQTQQLPSHCFKIKHFSGSVTYDGRDFVSRNQDALDRDLSQAMYECNHPLLKIIFPEGNPRRATRRRPTTAGTQFKISMGALMNNLGMKCPHYVRCLKPNEMKQPKRFDLPMVKHQIGYFGLVEMGLLRRHGYVFRMEYEQFLHRYKLLSVNTWPNWHGGGSVDGVTCLLRDLPISASEYAFGRTKLFIRSSKTFEMLEELRRERIDELATLIQKTFRGYIFRQKWLRLKDSQSTISNCYSLWKDKSCILENQQRQKEQWAAIIIQNAFKNWLGRRFLARLVHSLPSESPLAKEWPQSQRFFRDSNILLKKLYHKWRCCRYRMRFDQIARNRMREKVTASIIFKDRKASYRKSINHPFLGDYVRLRQNPQWKKLCVETNDQYVVFADIINKITRSAGKFVPILFVISTSSMLVMDQRTMQIKYRIPATEIFKISLSPFPDDIAVFHIRANSPVREHRSAASANTNIPGCLSSSSSNDPTGHRKGDFVLQTGHVIEIVTKLFLVVQNATGKPPMVNIATEFDANFGGESVTFAFKKSSQNHQQGHPLSEASLAHFKLIKKANRMEIYL